MPSCQDIREYLPFYAENEIPAEVRPDVEAHLATCLVCRTEADSYRNLRSELRNLKYAQADLAPSPAVWSGAVEGWNRWEQRQRRVVQVRFAVVGISLFLLMFGGAWAWLFSEAEFPVATVVADFQKMESSREAPQLETPDADLAAQWIRKRIGGNLAPVNLSLLGGQLQGASVLPQGRFKIGRLTYRTSVGLIALYVTPRQNGFKNAPTVTLEKTSFSAPDTHSPLHLLGWSQAGFGMGVVGKAEQAALGKFALSAQRAQSLMN